MPDPASKRSWPRWLALWLTLTVLSTFIHYLIWNSDQSAIPGSRAEAFSTKVLGNFVHVLTGPAWLTINAITYIWGYGSLWRTTLAIGVGWGSILYAISFILRTRALLLRPRARKTSANDTTPPAPCHRPAVPPTVGAPDAPETPDVPSDPINLSRRRLLIDLSLGLPATVAAGALVKGVVLDPWDLVIRRYSVPIADLPRSLDGLRIVQLADTHLGPRMPADSIAHAVDQAVKLQPDVFALVGDYLHNGLRYLEQAADLFKPLTAAKNSIAIGVLGNHDWRASGAIVTEALASRGIHMLDNSRTFLDASTRTLRKTQSADSLCLAGVGDLLEHIVDPDEALKGVDQAVPRIVLAHEPDSAEEKSVTRKLAPRIDLMLSGHTHGGQIAIPFMGTPFIPSRFGQKYAGGLVQGPRCRVLISRGIGMSIFPMRLGVPPELVEITLTRA